VAFAWAISITIVFVVVLTATGGRPFGLWAGINAIRWAVFCIKYSLTAPTLVPGCSDLWALDFNLFQAQGLRHTHVHWLRDAMASVHHGRRESNIDGNAHSDQYRVPSAVTGGTFQAAQLTCERPELRVHLRLPGETVSKAACRDFRGAAGSPWSCGFCSTASGLWYLQAHMPSDLEP
jgi:hypothetical protein